MTCTADNYEQQVLETSHIFSVPLPPAKLESHELSVPDDCVFCGQGVVYETNGCNTHAAAFGPVQRP